MAEEANNQQIFEIQRIYISDMSLESPNAPEVFLEQNWQPEIAIDLHRDVKNIEDGVYNISLTVTATAKANDKTAFLAEVKQSGIFAIKGFEKDQLDHLLNVYAPSILFHYAREAISDVVTRASFPQLLLAPINFEAIYEQEKQAASSETH
jgi:preprotein translocase subunit SecB